MNSFSTWYSDSIYISTQKEDACEHVKGGQGEI